MLSAVIFATVIILQLTSLIIAIYGTFSKDNNPYHLLIEIGIDFGVAGLMFVQVLLQNSLLAFISLLIWGTIIVLDFMKARDYKWKDDGGNYAI